MTASVNFYEPVNNPAEKGECHAMSIFRRDQDPYRGSQVQTLNRQPVPTPVEPHKPEPARAEPSAAAAPAPRVDAKPITREAAAVVDQKTEIKGTLHSEGNVLVQGCFQGEIEAKETVWVEQGARTEAQLRANEAVISGAFDGEVICQRRVHITSTASISGEIKTPILVIEEGSTVNCRFSMAR
jgi:cytoskeletal protein CcmA (bactofilin family)